MHRMNEGYRAWGARKCVNNRGLEIKPKRCLYEVVAVRSRGIGYEKC